MFPFGQLVRSFLLHFRKIKMTNAITPVAPVTAPATAPAKPPEPQGTAPTPAPVPSPFPTTAPSAQARWSAAPPSVTKQAKWSAAPAHAAPAPTPTPTPAPAPLSDPPSTTVAKGYVAAPEHEVPQELDPWLHTILSWPRKHDSLPEMQFTKWLRDWAKEQAKGDAPVAVETKSLGCLAVHVYRRSKGGEELLPSSTLFSCHVDTVEGATPFTAGADKKDEHGYMGPRKTLEYDKDFGTVALAKDSIGGSLGADDGAGVWLMMKMIEARVPGTYVFHRGEECGGLGSSEMSRKDKEWLSKYEIAVAFDRHDTFEVITHQRGGRCCSEKFADALCKRLNSKGMAYEPSNRGVFTDTANYRSIIAECTNIAVGYDRQHGVNETLDFAHLNALLNAVCAIDWDSLPVDRDPTVVEAPQYGMGYGRGVYQGNWGYGGSDLFGDAYEDGFGYDKTGARTKAPAPAPKAAPAPAPKTGAIPDVLEDYGLEACTLSDIETWIADNPEDAAAVVLRAMREIAHLRTDVAILEQMLGLEN